MTDITRRKQPHQEGISKNHDIHLRVSSADKSMMQSVAQSMDMTISRAIVELFEERKNGLSELAQLENSPQMTEIREIRAQIWHIGHNINQIARNTNRDMEVSIQDEYSVTNALKVCQSLLERVDAIITEMKGESTS